MATRRLAGPEGYPMPEDVAGEVERMTREADADVAEMRVNMRWGRPQVDVVKRAAALFGMPYQTYVKQAALRQAFTDLRAAETLPHGVPTVTAGAPSRSRPVQREHSRKRRA